LQKDKSVVVEEIEIAADMLANDLCVRLKGSLYS
jgi:hypothetical protein